MCSTCGVGFKDQHPEVTNFILNFNAQGLPPGLRMHFYLRCHGGGRSSGIASRVSHITSNIDVIAEFSFWPVGWVLTFDTETKVDAYDVTRWASLSPKDGRPVTITVPCHWASTFFPLDFRHPDEVIRQAKKSMDKMAARSQQTKSKQQPD